MTDDLPADLLERCALAIMKEQTSIDDVYAWDMSRIVLREAGVAEMASALEPFVALADAHDARYRKRGGNPDIYPDGHPSYDISADKRQLPMGAWRKIRAALSRYRGK